MRKSFIVIVAALFAACGSGRGKVAVEGDTAGQVIALSDSLVAHRKADTISFGRVHEGELVVKELTLLNAGDKAFAVTSLDLSCGCVRADYPREPLMPGAKAPVTLTLDTRDLRGWIFKTVGVRTSLTTQSYLLYITAEVEGE